MQITARCNTFCFWVWIRLCTCALASCCSHQSPTCAVRLQVVLTASGVLRGKKKLDVKKIVDKGLSLAANNGFQV